MYLKIIFQYISRKGRQVRKARKVDVRIIILFPSSFMLRR